MQFILCLKPLTALTLCVKWNITKFVLVCFFTNRFSFGNGLFWYHLSWDITVFLFFVRKLKNSHGFVNIIDSELTRGNLWDVEKNFKKIVCTFEYKIMMLSTFDHILDSVWRKLRRHTNFRKYISPWEKLFLTQYNQKFYQIFVQNCMKK